LQPVQETQGGAQGSVQGLRLPGPQVGAVHAADASRRGRAGGRSVADSWRSDSPPGLALGLQPVEEQSISSSELWNGGWQAHAHEEASKGLGKVFKEG
jgi:hypothetical protein